MKRHIVFVYFMLFVIFANGQSVFQKVYDGYAETHGMDIIQTIDQNYIVCGILSDSTNETFLLKLDQSGDTIWTKVLNIYFQNYSFGLVESPDGSVVITGLAETPLDGVMVMKIDSIGQNVWTKHFPINNVVSSQGYSIRNTISGGYIVNCISDYDIVLLDLNAHGDTLWTKRYVIPYPIAGAIWSDIQQTPDSGYILSCKYLIGDVYSYIMKIDYSGNINWAKEFTGPFMGDNFEINSCIPALDGGFLVCGTFYGLSTSSASAFNRMFILKLNKYGDPLWSKYFGSLIDYSGSSIIELADSAIIVGGWIGNLTNNSGGQFISKFDKNGNVVWDRYSEFPRLDVHRVKMTADNGFIMIGDVAFVNNDYKLIVLKLDSNGVLNCNQINEPLVTEYYPLNYSNLQIQEAPSYVSIIDIPVSISTGANIYDACDLLNFTNDKYLNSNVIYPNPFRESIHISVIEGEVKELKLFDLFGRVVYTQNNITNNIEVRPELTNGIYIYKISMKYGTEIKGRVIKN
jgi:hypothetical protein